MSDSATPWTVALQAPLSIEFSRQEYWSGLPFLSPGDFHNPGSDSGSPELKADSLPFESPGKPQTAIKTKRVSFTVEVRTDRNQVSPRIEF